MLLQLINVGKDYGGSQRETLKNIDLEIEEGEFICLVGPSGCGKSTLLNLIAGLCRPSKGEILLRGVPIGGPGPDRVMMFQEAALYPWLSVAENVKFGMELQRVGRGEREEKAERYLKMVQLWEFRDYPIHQLSGGMKQRTALARALALDSEILLMDEPFSALDKQTINLLRKELEEIWMKTRKTILFVTHSVEEAVFFADRVVILSRHPGEIRRIYPISLGRPRRIDDVEFIRCRSEILQEVQREVAEVEKEEYAVR